MDKKPDIFVEMTVAPLSINPPCPEPVAPPIPPEPIVPPAPPVPPEPLVPPAPSIDPLKNREEQLEEAKTLLRRMTGQTGFVTREEQFCLDAEALAERPVFPCEMAAFSAFYPTFSAMSEAQKQYYVYWKEQLLQQNALLADVAYFLLFLYETVNRTGGITPETALQRLHLLFSAAREQEKDCQNAVMQAAADLILYDGMKLDYLAVLSKWDRKTASKVFWTEVLSDPKKAAQLGLSFSLAAAESCKSRLLESPYYKKHRERTERAIFHLLCACNARYETESGGFLQRFVGRRALFYAPFSHLIFAGGRPCSLNGPYAFSQGRQFAGQNGKLFATLQGLSWSKQFVRTMTDLLKAAECLLREDDRFPGRLKYPSELPTGLQKTVRSAFDALLSEEKEAKRRQFVLNEASLSKIRRDTGVIRQKLIEELEGEGDLSPQRESGPKCAEQVQRAASEPKNEAHTQETPVLLTQAEGEILLLLLEEKPAQKAIEQAAFLEKMLPLAWMNRLSERLFELEQDTVLEETDGTWRIFADYRADVAALLARWKEHK